MGRNKSLENRAEVVTDAARKLFGRYGFEKTTIDDIAKEAGIGKGSVYLEFPNKQEILFAIIREFVEERHNQIKEYVENAEAPYLESLEQMLFIHALAVHERATSQIHTPDALLHTNIVIKQRFKKHFEFMKSSISTLLRKAAENKEIKSKTDFDEVTETIILGIGSICPPYLRNTKPNVTGIPTRKQLEKEAGLLVKLLIGGIKEIYGKK